MSATQESRSNSCSDRINEVNGMEDLLESSVFCVGENICEESVGGQYEEHEVSGEEGEDEVSGEVGEDDFSGEEEEEDVYVEEEQEEEDGGEEGEGDDMVQQMTEIPINGLEDMAHVSFNELTPDDLIRYHFPDVEVGFLFYSWYARMHGFAARKCRMVKNRKGEVVQQTFVCFREGKRKPVVGDVGGSRKRKRFPRKDTRCGCKAHFQVHVDNKRWYVKSAFDVHNHTLVELNMIGMVPAHRRMNEADISQMNDWRKAGVSTPQSYGVFAGQMGGFGNVTFTKQDMYNIQEKQRKNEVVDARGVLAFLRQLKEKDPGLFWNHTIDGEGSLDKLFWSDGCSRANYSVFGDVLAFDATYKKNKYKRPLVVFSGVNHHNQTIVFAAALVSNEKDETYVWLLEQFLEAMSGKAPPAVMTDGWTPMKNAIKKVFPRAHHRLCAWHLLRNAGSNVADPNFVSRLTICMMWDLETSDFEARWADMVVECGCEENEWVKDLYKRKEMWAAAYMRGKFFGGIRTTSRVEGLHAQVGKYVNSWNCLTDFMHNFTRYLDYQRRRELEADFASMHGEHVLQSQLRKLERSASTYYTDTIFKIVAKGLQRALILRVNLYRQTSTCTIFFVTRYGVCGRKWTVSFWSSIMEFKCCCMRFESHGLPCDHILAVLVFLDLVELPKSLVLNRWTKNAKEGLAIGKESNSWDPLVLCRFSALRESCRRLCKVACESPALFTESNLIVNAQRKKLEGSSSNANEPQVQSSRIDGERYIRNPPMPESRSRTRGASQGRGAGRRIINCGICGVAGHNRLSCVRYTQ